MTNKKVEGLVNNLGGVLCFTLAIVFGLMLLVGGASLMKTGKNYVVKPSAEVEASEEHGEDAEEAEESEESEDEE